VIHDHGRIKEYKDDERYVVSRGQAKRKSSIQITRCDREFDIILDGLTGLPNCWSGCDKKLYQSTTIVERQPLLAAAQIGLSLSLMVETPIQN
jgi:hypothetical protein